MGVDLNLVLPPNVRVGDVASVIGRLLGKSCRRMPLGGGSWSAEVADVSVRSAPGIAECASIDVVDVAGGGNFHALYHFEWSRPAGHRGIILRSTAKNIALAVALARFFGGTVVFSDHDPSERLEVPPKSDEENHATDGATWTSLQVRIEQVPPIAFAMVEEARAFAAYP